MFKCASLIMAYASAMSLSLEQGQPIDGKVYTRDGQTLDARLNDGPAGPDSLDIKNPGDG